MMGLSSVKIVFFFSRSDTITKRMMKNIASPQSAPAAFLGRHLFVWVWVGKWVGGGGGGGGGRAFVVSVGVDVDVGMRWSGCE